MAADEIELRLAQSVAKRRPVRSVNRFPVILLWDREEVVKTSIAIRQPIAEKAWQPGRHPSLHVSA
jgi:hypothetical protein